MRVETSVEKCVHAFTLAEVLITLGIIGIVAAMTLPSLIANHRKQVMLTKVKHTYNILSNALERAKVDYGTDINSGYIPTDGSTRERSMFFAETYMLPYLTTTNYCGDKYEGLYCTVQTKELGLTSTRFYLGPANANANANAGTAFMLNNGTIVYVQVGRGNGAEAAETSRIWMVYDIDGPQGYNMLGYDTFFIELGGMEGANKRNSADRNKLLPYGYSTSYNCAHYVSEANHACNPKATNPGSWCLAYIVCNGWNLGDKYPW